MNTLGRCCPNDIQMFCVCWDICKSTLGVRKQTPTPVIYGDTGRCPLIIKQHIKAVKYWYRALDLSRTYHVRIACRARWHWNHKQVLAYSVCPWTNWARKSSLYRETQHIVNKNTFMLSFKESIMLEYLYGGGDMIAQGIFWNYERADGFVLPSCRLRFLVSPRKTRWRRGEVYFRATLFFILKNIKISEKRPLLNVIDRFKWTWGLFIYSCNWRIK